MITNLDHIFKRCQRIEDRVIIIFEERSRSQALEGYEFLIVFRSQRIEDQETGPTLRVADVMEFGLSRLLENIVDESR